jgi:hypothetical protein
VKKTPLQQAVCKLERVFHIIAAWYSKPGMKMLRRREVLDQLGAANGLA